MTSAHMESRPPLAGFALLRTMADKLVARIVARSRSHSLWHSGFCLASHHLADTHAPMGGLRGSRRPFCLVGRGGRPAWPNGCALLARHRWHCRRYRRPACFRLAGRHRIGVAVLHRRLGDRHRDHADLGRDSVAQGFRHVQTCGPAPSCPRLSRACTLCWMEAPRTST